MIVSSEVDITYSTQPCWSLLPQQGGELRSIEHLLWAWHHARHITYMVVLFSQGYYSQLAFRKGTTRNHLFHNHRGGKYQTEVQTVALWYPGPNPSTTGRCLPLHCTGPSSLFPSPVRADRWDRGYTEAGKWQLLCVASLASPGTQAVWGAMSGLGVPRAALSISRPFMPKAKVRFCICRNLDYCSEIFSLFPYFQGGVGGCPV